ncbi:MAG: GIY-YIG nuclease family protein [Oryzomonas sp.]|uniref:GIY-YIG nuclease family protein n=1 Tax=Oryzomonas sp. TaxID=2855186 RepID=UPI002848A100|nr:GIY-YIG nuclease family protein [Oryzomonas sp.]MDR3579213.1 GIY-YIG nuclease family protein [Oryzomonas sp.]
MSISGYSEFEVDIERVLREQLPIFFEDISPAALTLENIEKLPPEGKGAYLLLYDDLPVYAGKTDYRHGFKSRLNRHFKSVQDRRNLDPLKVSFKAVRIFVFSALDVESIVIEELRKINKDWLKWNFSGFGSNDPGRKREGQEPAKFDVDYPIDVMKSLPYISKGSYLVAEVLTILKDNLPYLLRWQSKPKGRSGHDDFHETHVEFHENGMTVLGVMKSIVDALPGNTWQATVFPGRIILYKATKDYEFTQHIIKKS